MVSTNSNRRIVRESRDEERRLNEQRERKLHKQRQRMNEYGVRDGRVEKTQSHDISDNNAS